MGRRYKEGFIQPLKALNPMEPFRLLLQSYRGPFSSTRHLLKTYRPKTTLFFEKGHYIIKTISSGAELEEVLKLRYNIFYREFQNRKFPFGLDLDQFDHLADHLVIIDKRKTKIVGTYRLITSTYSNRFYSQSEFNLNQFLAVPGIKLELSRACILKSHRTGAVMNLLWRGIAQYLQDNGIKFMFGCASVRTMDLHETACVYRHLAETGVISQDYSIHPIGEYVMPEFADYVAKLEYNDDVKATAKGLLPPLFLSYLRMGAQAYGHPALDRDFRCVDFFINLRVENLQGLYEKKYIS